MRYNLKVIEFDKFELHSEAYKWSNINEHTKIDYFIYHNPNPTLFKVVLSWNITIRVNPDLLITTAAIEAEQEMIIDSTDGVELETLRNAISSSHLQLQMAFTEKVRGTIWEMFQFLYFDPSEMAMLLKADLEKPPPPPDILTSSN